MNTPFSIDKKIEELIGRLEAEFNRKVYIEIEKREESHHGESIIENNLLKVFISDEIEDKNELLLHELMHFDIKLLGVPNRIAWSIPNDNKREDNITYLTWFRRQVWDKIHHHYFYPIMKAVYDVNPFSIVENELNSILEKEEIPGLKEATKRNALATKYLQTYVETEDDNYLRRLKSLLTKKYDGVGILEGEELIRLFKTNNYESVDSFVPLFIRCFNYLHHPAEIIRHEIKATNEYKNSNDVYFFFS
jgi:hypothetical protein